LGKITCSNQRQGDEIQGLDTRNLYAGILQVLFFLILGYNFSQRLGFENFDSKNFFLEK